MKKNFRRELKFTFAIVLSFIFEHYFSLSHEYLIPITTVLVMITTVGNALHQGLQRFLSILIVVTLASWIFKSSHLIYARVLDVSMGAAIGILTNLFLLPERADVAFRETLIPVLTAYQQYFAAIVHLLLDKKDAEDNKNIVENGLLKLPLWVYKPGFNIFLQRGQRFFLLKIEQVGDILFSMHYLARQKYSETLLSEIREPLQQCTKRVNEFFSALITILELKKLPEGVTDFAEDISGLEKALRAVDPLPLDLLSLSKDNSYFAAFIYDLKDLHREMVSLAQALR